MVIPEVIGQDGATVRSRLEELGLTDVSLLSANPKYSAVVLAANWTAVSIDPPPGTVVASDHPIVVQLYRD
ncbi:PASTA domain-containing protein [Mycobacterium lacus]|uniref:PASTA domain-containing protein n=1 Tax=Mycobacterium lacus TaxID=169765 RepID=A0A1X1Y9F3_9MYCO|nr:PASTA domain-containing protein [Mycobacterium lacus]MCV7125836.1 PASTA domain-containing protein [Mycobacterium lacus]ORW07718.1 hypothetical protein AWC15_19300 [Mycobacterium lacus]BBX98578.1 hypothetical protein MLAC_38720 [Mycobacterium lacus]